MLGAFLFTSRIPYNLPFQIVVLILGFASFLLSLLIRSTMVFLDKCCIPQNDPVAKSYGISRLADYLRVSNKLLILWSPDYLERLWCVYELAVFLRTHQKDDVILVNLNHIKLCVSLMLLQWFGILIQLLEVYLFGSVKPNMLSGYALALASAFSIGLGAFRCAEDWQRSYSRVKSFSVHRSKCTSLADYSTLKQRITGMYSSEARFAEVVRGLWLDESGEDHMPRWLFCRSSLRLMCAPYIVQVVASTVYSIVNATHSRVLPLMPLHPSMAVGSSTPGLNDTPPSSVLADPLPSSLLAALWALRFSIIPNMMMAFRAPCMLLVGHKLATSCEPNGFGRWRLRITFAVCFAAYSGLTYMICGLRDDPP
ncbi:hypothetical protein FOZ63_014775 [Perkinsus olseni]|uniref:TIR domain-containing protein n=1 Tax=Perkinsus olseni TaxID=32597 RepID=A0A7J6U7E2_PEROL|nr:hypothetical protein FOZ62_000288 [Perkinsus olseni]KAF4756906.1 hypothetical protein FOZ63_014775 [Perkinsus olseni]